MNYKDYVDAEDASLELSRTIRSSADLSLFKSFRSSPIFFMMDELLMATWV